MKKITLLALVVLIMLSSWYLFIKKHDYQITFKVKGTPISVYHLIVNKLSWGGNNRIKNVRVIGATRYNEVQQQVKLQDTVLDLDWYIEGISDSITKIKVGITSGGYSISNRLGVLTGETEFTRSLKKELKSFGKTVNDFAGSYKVQIDGRSEIPSLEYLSVSVASKRIDKASMMVKANADLHPKIAKNKIQKNGYPFVRIKEWNVDTDSIKFEFGFPIVYQDSLPTSSKISYHKEPLQKAIKATFYGNYRNSDQAWFALLAYAKKNHISVEATPIEIFYNNPMEAGDSSQWKAEVFLPIIE